MKFIKGPSKTLYLWLITITLVLFSVEVGLRIMVYFLKKPPVNNVSILNATTLGSSVVSSSLTSLGTL